MNNKIFNRLTVIRKSLKTDKNYNTYCKCKCSCGNYIIVRESSLKNNHTQSCGCLQKDIIFSIGKQNKKHNLINTKFYTSWKHMKERCNNPNCKGYKYWGGRGIKYDPRWDNFLIFKKDMYMKYLYAIKQQHIKNPSIERKDVNGDYNSNNCIFIPKNEQSKNRRNTKCIILY